MAEGVALVLALVAGAICGIGIGAAWVTARMAARVAHLEARTMALVDAGCDVRRRFERVEGRVEALTRDTVILDNARRRSRLRW